MRLPLTAQSAAGAGRPWCRPFTLLELIVVMLVLVTMMGLAAPRLAGFLPGRRLDDEARRLWALTRHGQQEAIRLAVPMVLRLDRDAGTCTLTPAPGYALTLPARQWQLAPTIAVALVPEPTPAPAAIELTWWSDGLPAAANPAALVLHNRQRPDDAWRLTQQPATGAYVLAREPSP